MKRNEFINKLIRRSNYMDKLVYVTADGGRREIKKLKPKKRNIIIPSNIIEILKGRLI